MTNSRRLLAAALASGMAIVACSNGDEVTPTTSAVATTTTVVLPDEGDGQLVLGVLLPTGDTVLGAPMVAATQVAVDRINAAGGVLGSPVQSIVADEGDTTASATEAIQSLLDDDVDAIIGPASSLTALSTLDQIVSSGTVACSPTASALALDEFPDDGLFFRTVPSDSLQARAIAEAAIQTGAVRATVVHVDDSYGRAFADSVTASMAGGPISLDEPIVFSGRDDDLTDEAQQLLDAESTVAIVLAGDEDGTRFLETLGRFDTSALSAVIVNDTMRSTATPQRIAGLDPELRRRIIGLAPEAQSPTTDAPYDPPGLFATNAYDCVNLIALAAVRADSDVPADIAEQVPSISTSGSACRTFTDCVAAIDAGLQVDYDGPSGLTELSVRTGDPSQARFDRFSFGEDGADEVERTVVVG